MRHAASRQLHAYWDALRGGRAAPGRDEIDPAAIRGVLASVFMLDVAALPLPRPADATFSLSGTRIDALFGRMLRGSTFDSIWDPRSAALAAAALDAALGGGRPVVAAARGGPPGRGAIDVELLLLPLASGAGRRARVLGSLGAASAPDWMGLSAAAPLDLTALEEPRFSPRAPDFGRRVARPFAPHPGGRREPPHPLGRT